MNTIALDMADSNESKKCKYKVIIERKSDGEFIAKVPTIPSCSGTGKNSRSDCFEYSCCIVKIYRRKSVIGQGYSRGTQAIILLFKE